MYVRLEGWKSPTVKFFFAKLSLLFTELEQLPSPSNRHPRTIKSETSEQRRSNRYEHIDMNDWATDLKCKLSTFRRSICPSKRCTNCHKVGIIQRSFCELDPRNSSVTSSWVNPSHTFSNHQWRLIHWSLLAGVHLAAPVFINRFPKWN